MTGVPAGRQFLHLLDIAFDVETGEMNCTFELTPNDSWDYDENGREPRL